MKKIISLVFVSALGGIFTLGAYLLIIEPQKKEVIYTASSSQVSSAIVPVNYLAAAEKTDFTQIAENTVNAVVHVKNVSVSSVERNSAYHFFYGSSGETKQQIVVGTGSGVIISEDGYIITNNHVIKGATKLEITLNNKKTYQAVVVGIDESTDIALLKIEKNNLPYLTFGDSDALKVGEWVLAVGNPFNLTSTVTAGIVSAKARDINAFNNNSRIESFIQTDAAVNPGNSGGALVNVQGELIGINTAISSQTGSYVGYSFAVPSNISRKVIEDILEYGNVQRAYLGINYEELDSAKADDFGVSTTEGVIITRLLNEGAAKEAGMLENDIIIKMEEVKINNFSDLQGFLGSKRPNDLIQITVLRDENEKIIPVKLKNQFGKFEYGSTDFSNYFIGGLEPVSKREISKYGINHGLKIVVLKNKRLSQTYGIKSGDIILDIEDQEVEIVEDVETLLKKHQNKEYVVIKILTKEGRLGYIRLRNN